MKIFRKSWLGNFNYFILQWFFIRLAKVVDSNSDVEWKILFGIVPLTGWETDYKYIFRE